MSLSPHVWPTPPSHQVLPEMMQMAAWCVPGLFMRAALGGNFDTFWEARHDGPFPSGVPKIWRTLTHTDSCAVMSFRDDFDQREELA